MRLKLGIQMSYRDILLPILTYPDQPSPGPIKAAFHLTKQFEANLTAVLLDLDPHRSAWPSSLGTSLAGIADLVGEAVAQSRANSRQIMEQLKAEASKSRVKLNIVHEPTAVFPVTTPTAERARLYDLTIMPATSGFDRWFREGIIFGSGSPVLLVPDDRNGVSLETVVVAWDFSLTASRALRASMPLLSEARSVRIFTIANEKESTQGHTIAELERHLAEHKITFTYDNVDIAGRSIGEAFRAYTQSVGADMLVMGAFGHSRIREFVLGGATQSMLAESNLPVLFAH